MLLEKPNISTNKIKSIRISVEYVFRADFNDTYWLDEIIIDIDRIYKDKLSWFDPFCGKSKINDTCVAILEISDEKIVALQRKNGEITKIEAQSYVGITVCEDYDSSRLLSARIGCVI